MSTANVHKIAAARLRPLALNHKSSVGFVSTDAEVVRSAFCRSLRAAGNTSGLPPEPSEAGPAERGGATKCVSFRPQGESKGCKVCSDDGAGIAWSAFSGQPGHRAARAFLANAALAKILAEGSLAPLRQRFSSLTPPACGPWRGRLPARSHREPRSR